MSEGRGLTCGVESQLHQPAGVAGLRGSEPRRHRTVQEVDGGQQSFGVEQEVQRRKVHLQKEVNSDDSNLNTWLLEDSIAIATSSTYLQRLLRVVEQSLEARTSRISLQGKMCSGSVLWVSV